MFNLIGLIVFSTLAHADESDGLKFTQNTSWIFQADSFNVRESILNPSNRFLKYPNLNVGSEIRPDLKFEFSEPVLAVVRPRFKFSRNVYYQDSVRKDYDDSELYWNEVYGQLRVNENLQIAYGKINFQWGPAELLPPSNELFRNVEMQPSPLFQFEGKHLFKLNSSIGKNFSLILLAAADDNQSQLFQSHSFNTLVIKPEYSWNGSADYFGFVGGVSKNQKSWFGEYFALNPSDALQLYGDIAHSTGRDRAYSVAGALPGTKLLSKNQSDSKNIEHRALTGARYTFERGDEIRLEYFYQSEGYNHSEFSDAVSALNDSTFGNLNRASFASNPSGFQGKHYLYTSIRIPSLLNQGRLTLTPRAIVSVQDFSALAFLTTEYNLSDHAVLVIVCTQPIGKADQELTLGNRGLASVAVQYTF